ncbi:MAG: MFS transporter [Pseudomonadota bacterium]
MKSPFQQNSQLGILISVMFIYITGLGLLIPALPFMVYTSGGNKFESAVVFTIFSGCAFLSAPFWGFLSDKIGRKKVLLLSALGTIIGYVYLGLSSNVSEIFLSRAIAGLSAGWLIASQSIISDVTTPEERTRAMGFLGAAFGVGFTLGPLSTGIILSDWVEWFPTSTNPFSTLSFIAGFLSFVAGIIVYFKLKETQHKKNIDKTHFIKLFYHPSLRFLFTTYSIIFIIFTTIEASFALWCLDLFGFGAMEIGFLLGITALVSAFIQGGLLGKLKQYFSENKLIVFSALSLLSALILLIIIKFLIQHEEQQSFDSFSFMLAMGPILLVAIAMSLHNPIMSSLVSQIAPQNLKGSALSGIQLCSSFARIIGPAWAGLIYQHWGSNILYIITLSFGLLYLWIWHTDSAKPFLLNHK